MGGKLSIEIEGNGFDCLGATVPKEWKDEIQAFAKLRGENLNEFIVLAVVERMQRLGFRKLKDKNQVV